MYVSYSYPYPLYPLPPHTFTRHACNTGTNKRQSESGDKISRTRDLRQKMKDISGLNSLYNRVTVCE